MPDPEVVSALLARHGRTYAAEAGIVVDGSSAASFQVLCLSLLLSARIRASVAVRAAAALVATGWGTPQALAGSAWEQRTAVLNGAGYARYDESTARMLGRCAHMVLDRYGGDLGRLREAAGADPGQERRLLRQFPGIGPLGATIFGREIQAVWTEWYPFADARALDSADQLGLPREAAALAALAGGPEQFVRLVAALVRASLAKDHAAVLAAARGTPG